jgi:hypothetical protein
MAGIAPLAGSTTTPAPTGVTTTVPSPVVPTPKPAEVQAATPIAAPQPAIAAPPAPAPGTQQNFTNFPTSYAGFGKDGNAYGSLGVVNGKLSVVSDATPAPSTPAPQTPTPYTAIPPATTGDKAPPVSQGDAAKNGVADAPVAGTKPAASTTTPAPPTGTAKSDAPIPGSNPPASDTTSGLLGANSSAPGVSAPQYNPEQGLLGAPATNPIVIQAEAQERSAAEASAVAAQQQANLRNSAALGQLLPKTLRPEIPTVFLDIAS